MAKFPREHRHTLTKHMADLALGLHDALVAARHLEPSGRAKALLEADIRLDQLRQHLQMAWRWQWLSNGQYEHVSALTDELGRLVGGWRRSQASVRPAPLPTEPQGQFMEAEKKAAPEQGSERGQIPYAPRRQPETGPSRTIPKRAGSTGEP